ncbi:MAG: SGNH/GDSL hydrolase family protein [Ginsengibacter sp.]
MDTAAIPNIADTTRKAYLALGDSYTVGSAVSATESFPLQTTQLLKQQSINIGTPEIFAVNGWTTLDLLNALNLNPPQNNYSIVTLLIGVNNQYQGRSLDEYKTEFTDLLNRSILYAGNNKEHVIVLSIPDYSVTPFANGRDTDEIVKEIDDFNAANKTIALNAGIHYLDITSISREAKNDPSLIAIDGLHPSGSQYKKWSELLAPVILQAIK